MGNPRFLCLGLSCLPNAASGRVSGRPLGARAVGLVFGKPSGHRSADDDDADERRPRYEAVVALHYRNSKTGQLSTWWRVRDLSAKWEPARVRGLDLLTKWARVHVRARS